MSEQSKECYTPGVWKANHLGGHAWQIISLIDEKPIAVVTTTEHDARLIVDAPNMFQVLKQGLLIDANWEHGECPCSLCVATRRIVKRVLEG